MNRRQQRKLLLERLEDRRLLALGPQLVSLRTSSGDFLSDGDTRNESLVELTFRFNEGQRIDGDTLDAIRLTRSGFDGVFGDANDVDVPPGFLGIGDFPNEVVMRFVDPLPDDAYRIDLIGTGTDPLTNVDGDPFQDGADQRIEFELDLGAQVIAVVPQPTARIGSTLTQLRDRIDVYFNDDDLFVEDDALGNPTSRSAENPLFYQLILTNDTVDNTDDVRFYPVSVDYSPAENRATLTFADDLVELVDPSTGQPVGTSTFRLRVGVNQDMPAPPSVVEPAGDVGSSVSTSLDLGTLSPSGVLVASRIDPQENVLDFPGAPDEPGHRDLPSDVGGGFDQHLNELFGADDDVGVTTILYNFRANYGTTPTGDPLTNVITQSQRRAARQAFSLWGDKLGVQFLETADQGLTIVTGDPTALDPTAPDVVNHALDFAAPDLNFIARVDPNYSNGMLILDNANQWNDTLGGDWFRTAMIGIGFMLGLERADDLPESTIMSYAGGFQYPGSPPAEPVMLDNHDIVHGQYLYRPDSNDIDLYRFEVDLGDAGGPDGRTGVLTLETIAERQANASTLDSLLALYKEVDVLDETGAVIRREPQLIARNDNYFNEDSYIEVEVTSGTYFVGVTASGNKDYDPIQEDTGFGGTSQGVYDLRVGIRPQDDGDLVIRDRDRLDEGLPGTPLDGDADGTPGGAYNFWFRAGELSDVIFVDKSHATLGTLPRGTLVNPYNRIRDALSAAQPGDIVRVVANGGLDGNLSTLSDNFAYEIGFGTLPGQQLQDGTTFAVPKGVTVMADPGAIFKLRQARIGVGSSSLGVDRSNGALQVLGTPAHQVYFTSWLDEEIGLDNHLPTTTANPGDWGGIVFRNDLDSAELRFNYENEGIFLNYVGQADIRYGGGRVTIDSVQQVVNPIQMVQMRPTVTYNSIRLSADAAMSADPNSFEETNYLGPRFQQEGLFTPDYSRIGPDIHGNRLADNSTNGLFVRIVTPAGGDLRRLTVPGRFNDTDIVHVLAENLQVEGAPGGRVLDISRPPSELVSSLAQSGGSLAAGTYNYKVVFIDGRGFQGRPSLPTSDVSVSGAQGRIRLDSLPPIPSGFLAKQIYRSQANGQGPYEFVAELPGAVTTFIDDGTVTGSILQRDPPDARGVTLTPSGGGTLAAGDYNYRLLFVAADGKESPSSDPTATVSVAAGGSIALDGLPAASAGYVARRLYRSTDQGSGPYTLVAELDAASPAYNDDGSDLGATLDPASFGVVRGRAEGRLRLDPGTIIKLEGARIEVTFGAQILAEGTSGRGVVMTSKRDDRYGAGGTFDTNNDADSAQPAPGDWGGIYVGPLGVASIDHALLAYGGGITRIEGTFTAFNVLEVHEGELRLAHSVVENAAPGVGGLAPADRFGRGTNLPATIFVRGAQPVLLDNQIRNNSSTALTINANSLTHHRQPDPGRGTGLLDEGPRFEENQGPLVRDNILFNNSLNGMVVRGETLTTESVWDDTDIVHVLFDQVIVPNFHTYGGLRLQSSPTDRLVVKFSGSGDNFDSRVGAGITVTGRQLEIDDRIGGMLHIVGEPDFPVILTSLSDDTVGAGQTPTGELQTDTNNDGILSVPEPGDWRSIRLDQNSHDRNVEVVLEREAPGATTSGENDTPSNAQFLGDLAPGETGGDDNLRLGFEIRGLLQEKADVDVYSFDATAGTEVWFDIDRTTGTLDTVIELIDSDGVVQARTDNSLMEAEDPGLLFHSAAIPPSQINPLPRTAPEFQPRHASGLPKDFWSLNVHDAGMRLVLPGVEETRSTYHVRVRSSSEDLDQLDGGLTQGAYVLQIRLRETDELPGSTIRNADIRYATNGIELFGLPGHSPLLGEAAEDEEIPGRESNNHLIWNANVPGSGAQDLGNLLSTDRGATSVAGSIATLDDVDFFEFQVRYDAMGAAVHTFEHFPAVFDIDYADGLSRPNTNVTVFDEWGRPVLIGRDSNVADDRLHPLADGDLSNLSNGSIGVLDPYIGPVQLPEGTYFVAVTSNARLPRQLLQNPLTRVEPVNSITRVVEERIEQTGGATGGAPTVPVFLDNSSILPMDPEQVTLFVIQDVEDDDDMATLTALNPLTGEVKWTVADYEGQVYDIATRLDGNVFGFSSPDTDINDDTAGLFQGINTSLGQFLASRDSGILTFEEDALNPGIAIPSDAGMLFTAMTFGELGDGVERLFAVGTRGDFDMPPSGPDYLTNILYEMDPRTGQAIGELRTGNARFQGGGTQITERGFLDTNVSGGPGGQITGLAALGGTLYALSDTSGLFRVVDPLTTSARLEYIGDLVASAGVVDEVEENNDLMTAQDLDQEVWTQRYSDDIGDEFTNTSTTIKHITIHGTGDDGFVDLFPGTEVGDLDMPMGMAIGPHDGHLYVASYETDEILRFDGATGAFIDAFVTSGTGGLDGPMVPLWVPDLNGDAVPDLYVSSFENNAVLRFDGATGLSLGTLTIGGGLSGPTDMTIGPDFNGDGVPELYVSSSGSNTVDTFDAITGLPRGLYIGPDLGGLSDPQGLVIAPDGRMFVNSRGNNTIIEYPPSFGTSMGPTAATTVITDPRLQSPGLGLVIGPDFALYASSTGNDSVLRLTPLGIDTYVAPDSGGLEGPEDLVFINGGANLLVSSSLDDKVLLYRNDGTTASFVDSFVPQNTGGLNEPREMVIGPDGRLYVASARSDSILRFIPETKTFDTIFVPSGRGGLDAPHGLTFGPDRSGDGQPDLYVTSGGTNEVLVYNGVTGSSLGTFVNLGLDEPTGIRFGPDATGDGIPELYVANLNTDNIMRYNGATGVFVSQFVPTGLGGLDQPGKIEFRSDGLLYVASGGTNEILRYRSNTGAFVDDFISAGLGGLNGPASFVFASDSNVYVTSYNNNAIYRYEAATGAFVDDFSPAGLPMEPGNEGLNGPVGILQGPDGLLYVASSLTDQIYRFDTEGTPTYDYYKFSIENDGDRAIFDIDYGDDGNPGSFDSVLILLDDGGGVVDFNDDFSPLAGAGGSVNRTDSYLEVTLNEGEYYLVVAEHETVEDELPTGNRADRNDTYTLHISVENWDGRAFAGMARRPRFSENGPFVDTLLSIDTFGDLYAFDTGAQGRPFFSNGQSQIATDVEDAFGLALSSTLWHITDTRRSDLGHGLTTVYDDSRGNATNVEEIEANDTLAEAHDLEQEFWSLRYDANIGDDTEPGDGGPVNTSTFLPHVSVQGRGDGTHDFYSFEVTTPNSLGLFEIDMSLDHQLRPNGFLDDDPFQFMDAELTLLDSLGNVLAISQEPNEPTDGDAGNDFLVLHPFAEPPLEPFISFTFAEPGTYVLQVTKRTLPVPFHGLPPDEGDFYTLNVSVQDHRVDGPKVDGGQSLFFGTNITGVVENATPGEVRITSPGHGLLGGERVYVEGIEGLLGANGTFEVDMDSEDVFTLVDSDALGTYRGGGTWRLLRMPEDLEGQVLSRPFSLRGYAPEDKPTLYFNYLLDADEDPEVDIVSVSLLEEDGTITPLAVKHDGLNPVPATIPTLAEDIVEIVWRQTRVELDAFAGKENMRLLFEFRSNDDVVSSFEGFFVDDIVIGFAERGEMISHTYNDPIFVANPDLDVDEIVVGDYQLEIRQATDYGRSSLLVPDTEEIRSLHLEQQFDTNDRQTRQFTMLLPDGASIADGQTFSLYDGIDRVVFEFDKGNQVAEGNVRIPISDALQDYEVARRVRDAINSDSPQSILEVTAGLSDGRNEGALGNDHRLNLYGNAIIDAPGIPVVAHDGRGDTNLFRDQGQLLVHSNFITDARDWGILADAGVRDMEEDVPGHIPAGFLQPSLGPVRRLRELNNDPQGGLAPGVTIENNVIAGEGLGGIHFGGNEAPFEIVPLPPIPGMTPGDRVCDGSQFLLRSHRTSVVFEFEDISGSNLPCGSGLQGGNGWTPGTIPVFYRRSGSYPTLLGPRGPGYDQSEMVLAIRDAINGSILVTNGTTQVVRATEGLSRAAGDVISGAWPALYLENVSVLNAPAGLFAISRQVPLAEAAQPFGRIVNNTIYGHDGTQSFFAGSGLDEPNDTIFQAVPTRQGRAQNPEVYVTAATIGDSPQTPFDRSQDVDFYQIHLDIYDRVTIDIDANELGSELNSVVRLFNALGEEVASSDNDAAPGETDSLDSYLDFTATEAGAYYVGVSGGLNNGYSAISLGDRAPNSSVGDYRVEINVWAPRDWVIEAVDGTLVPDGATIQIKDVLGNVRTYEFDSGGGVVPGNIPIPFDPSPLGTGNRGSGYRTPEMAVATAEVLGQGLVGVTATPLGGHRGATPNGPVADRPSRLFLLPLPDRDIDPDMEGFSHNHWRTIPVSTTERYIVIEGAANVTSSFLPLAPSGSNGDQLLPETGILVSENASPTLLNNVLLNVESGIIQESSPTTVVGASLYQHVLNTTSNVGSDNEDFSITLGPLEPLFVDPALGNFYPAERSRAIDSAIDTLEDRGAFISVKEPVGISVSPILAPDRDASGQLRTDDPDVAPPLGLGANVFKDRGAVDRADFVGPTAVLVAPLDNDPLGVDLDPTETVVQLSEGQLSDFRIQLVDGATIGDGGAGIGVDDSSVTADRISVTEDGVLLRPGVDYNFRYDATTNVVSLTHVTGIWPDDRTYVIRLNNTDRFVIDAPRGDQVLDGQSFTIEDQQNNSVTFEYESGYSIFVPEPLKLIVPPQGVGPGGITDGQILRVVTPAATTVIFEFDTNSPPNVFEGNLPIDVSSATTVDDVADAIVDALDSSGIGLQPVNLGGGVVHLGAAADFLVDTVATVVDQAGIAGVVSDGETFTIFDGPQPFIFEFEDTDLGDGVGLGNNPIEFDVTFTQDELADAIAQAIAAQPLGLAPVNLGGGHIHVAGEERHELIVPVSSRLTASGQPGVESTTRLQLPGPLSLELPAVGAQPGGIEDGQTFSIDDGSMIVVFEWDDVTSNPGVAGSNTPIRFRPTDSIDDLAENLADVISMAGLGLLPDNIGGGIVELNAGPNHVVDATRTTLSVIGSIDGVRDGETFTIRRGDQPPVVFEFDSNRNTTPGNRVIRFDSMTTDEQLVDATIAAIQAGGVGLNPVKIDTRTLDLMDTAEYATDVLDSSLRKSGLPGGAVAVPFVPGEQFDERSFAQVIIEAIVNSPLEDVRISQRGASSFFVENVDAVSGDIPSFYARGIRDLAGNLLLPNQASSQTQFIIVMPDVQLDFGDLPQPPYATTFAQDGARHAITTEGLFLGAGVDADADGQPSAAADGDDSDGQGNDEDGVRFEDVFNPFLVTPLTVTASLTGLLDAWIDFNQDGDFEDLGEQVFISERLFAGDNALSIDTPEAALPGMTYARFRFSSAGETAPTGLAADGEVEDYRIEILPGMPPTAFDDAYQTSEDALLSVDAPGVLLNDEDLDSPSITVLEADATSSLGASVTVSPNGSLEYDPNSVPALQSLAEGQSTEDHFTYRATDGVLPSNRATVRITVTGLNDAPQAADMNLDVVEDGMPLSAPFDGDDIDSDDSQNTLVYRLRTTPAEGTVVNNGDGTFTFDPAGAFQDLDENEVRVVSFEYEAVDRHDVVSNAATVTITVTGVNDAPSAGDVDVAAMEDGLAVTEDFDGDDADSEDGPTDLVYTLLSTPSEGSVTNNANGTFTFDPGLDFQDLAQGQTRLVSFDYQARDRRLADSNVATVRVTVTGVNDAPTTGNVSLTAREDGPLVPGSFAGDDTDSDNSRGNLTYTVLTLPGEGLVINNNDGTFGFAPGSDFQDLADGETRDVTFTYRATDRHGAHSNTSTVTVRVSGRNDAPVVDQVAISAQEDGDPVTAPFAGDDVDSDDDPTDLTFVLASVPSEGTVMNLNNGTFRFDPGTDFQDLAQGQTRVVTFDYRAIDSNGAQSALGTVVVTVTGVNDTPLVTDVAIGAREDGPAVRGPFGGSDVDSDDSQASLVYEILEQPSEGSAANVGGGTFEFDPGSDFQDLSLGATRVVTFRYRATDRHSATSVEGAVNVTVTGVNDAPVAADMTTAAVEDGPAITVPFDADDVDNNDNQRSLGYSLLTTPAQGSITQIADGRFTYDVRSAFQDLGVGQTRSVFFDYRATDRHGASDTGRVEIVVSGVNDTPIAVLDTFSTDQLTALNRSAPGLLSNDSDVDGNDSIRIVRLGGFSGLVGTSTLGAAVTLNANGSFSYDPTASATLLAIPRGNSRVDTFTYVIADNSNAQATATVSVTVSGVNKPPQIGPDQYATQEDTPLSIAAANGLLTNDVDPDGDPLSISSFQATSAKGASVSVGADGSFQYDPRTSDELQALGAGDTADDTFEVTVSDGQGANVVATVIVTVSGLNEPPTAVNDTVSVLPNTATTIAILDNDVDPDGQLVPTSIVLVTTPVNGTATGDGNGNIIYTPDPDYRGTDTFRYTVKDNDGAVSNTALVTILVNDPPVAVDDSAIVPLNTQTTIQVLSNDQDVDGMLIPGTVTVVTSPQHGTATANADGTITYIPDTDYLGDDSFQYTVNDDSGTTSNVATVSLDISSNPFPWNNPRLRYDVNGDGRVTAVDPLIIINYLNSNGSGPLPIPPTPPSPPPYLDVVADNTAAPSDVNAVINFINSNVLGEGERPEGEAPLSNQFLADARVEYEAVPTFRTTPQRPPGGAGSSEEAVAPRTRTVSDEAAEGLLAAMAGDLAQRRAAHAHDLALEEWLAAEEDQ